MGKHNPTLEGKPVYGIEPDAYSAGTKTGDEIDTLGHRQAGVYLMVGDMGASATLDVKVQSASTSGGSFSDITGAAFTQAVQGTDDNLVFVGSVTLTEQARYIKIIGVTATQPVDYAVLVVLSDAQVIPVSQTNTVAFTV